jgi:nucleobase:cation symporter-1, NCS1 family
VAQAHQVHENYKAEGKSDALHSVYEGSKPTHTGDNTMETQGIAPIPESNRYGSVKRIFAIWFTPNMELSGVFIGTLAVLFGLGFGLGFVAIVIGTIIGALPVAIMCAWGPKTGTGQLPLARLPFGKSVLIPSAVQWLSAVGWIALGSLFGGQAAQLLFHVPFWFGLAIVLFFVATISIFGYEYIQRAQTWGAAIMIILFAFLTVRIFFFHNVVLPSNTVHGPALVGAFVLMVTIALSSSLSWASYASDYSRYLKPNTSSAAVFWYSMGGMVLSYIWVLTIGLAGASILTDQTAGGVRTLVGGGALGEVALATIVLAEIISSSMNDYSASLAFQTLGVRIKRPFISLLVMFIAFVTVLYMNSGNLSSKFENILLFASYWLAPFCAIVMIDWYYHKRKYTADYLKTALAFNNLKFGWAAIISFLIGFAAMIPFMDTSLVVGYVSHKLQGADLAFYVGFIVAGLLYFVLRRWAPVGDTKNSTVKPQVASSTT